MNKRTHSCGELRTGQIGQTVALAGWVNNYRDHGGVIFVDLRDREGLTQVVFHPEHTLAHDLASKLRHEDVIWVEAKVVERGVDEAGRSLVNPKLATGQIEVQAHGLEILNKAQTPPFTPDDGGRTGEENRLRWRYVDLRRPRMQHILRTRHRLIKIIRDYFDELKFYEVETPMLCRSTPEGARDFLVPSRVNPGQFYALPQSPQLFKQVLMASGVEKYVQIAKCFRDEDPRADRQAEFTQLDMEMSFVSPDDVMQTCEGLMRRIWKQLLDVDLVDPIPRMDYTEAVSRYGSDRPDLRFGLELVDISDLARQTDFKVFREALAAGGVVKAICIPGGARLSRKQTDALAEWVKQFGAGGLPVTKVNRSAPGALATGIAKFLEPFGATLIERMGGADGDLFCFGVDAKSATVHRVLGELRVKMAQDMALIQDGQWQWLWIIDFPLVKWNEQDRRWDSLHHPFTSPVDEDLDRLESDPASVRSKAYDLVVNGSELGGGSIRIHRMEMQHRVFNLLGINEEQARQKFGFLLDALRYGAPPHGGIAFGIDRIAMHLCGTNNIRDVIAFPKTQTGADLMTEAPAPVGEDQLQELHLRIAAPSP